MSNKAESATPLRGGTLAVGYCSLIGALSTLPGWGFLLFPELGPLSASVLSQPSGRWASSPWQLVVVPTAAAVCGLWISDHIPVESLALLLAVLTARLLLSLLRSSLVPALSAAALPVILDIHSWAYPMQIALGLGGLTLLLMVLRRGQRHVRQSESNIALKVAVEPGWLQRWLLYLLVMVALVQLSGWRVMLLPPLIVISHERFAEPEHCPWLGRAWQLPLSCGITATMGVLNARLLASHVALAMAISLGLTLLLMQRLRLWLPPLLAVAVLPLLLPNADARYVLGIVAAAAVLSLSDRRPAQDGISPPPARARWWRCAPWAQSR